MPFRNPDVQCHPCAGESGNLKKCSGRGRALHRVEVNNRIESQLDVELQGRRGNLLGSTEFLFGQWGTKLLFFRTGRPHNQIEFEPFTQRKDNTHCIVKSWFCGSWFSRNTLKYMYMFSSVGIRWKSEFGIIVVRALCSGSCVGIRSGRGWVSPHCAAFNSTGLSNQANRKRRN